MLTLKALANASKFSENTADFCSSELRKLVDCDGPASPLISDWVDFDRSRVGLGRQFGARRRDVGILDLDCLCDASCQISRD